jgi:hypothetical protein
MIFNIPAQHNEPRWQNPFPRPGPFQLLEILNNRYKTAKQKQTDRNKNNVELISRLYEELFDAMI